MKNKFKKSKIIVPALALITATTVASVTGTVAWFTASRAVTVNATTFETKTEGSNLTVTTTADATAGTTSGTTTASSTASISVDGSLTHGSYNAAKATKSTTDTTISYPGKLYSPNVDDSGNVESYNDLDTLTGQATTSEESGTTTTTYKWQASSASTSGKLWYAVSWKMTFTQTADPNGYTNALLFDPSSSTAKENNDATGITEENSTIKGLRIALMTTDKCIVVARDNVQTHVTSVERYNYTQCTSSDTFNPSTTYYTAPNPTGGLYTKAANLTEDGFGASKTTYYTRNASSTTDASSWGEGVSFTQFGSSGTKPADLGTITTNDMYLGNIDATDGLTVCAVAWFEGTDTSAITTYTDQQNATARYMSKVNASLGFYSRKTVVTTGD